MDKKTDANAARAATPLTLCEKEFQNYLNIPWSLRTGHIVMVLSELCPTCKHRVYRELEETCIKLNRWESRNSSRPT